MSSGHDHGRPGNDRRRGLRDRDDRDPDQRRVGRLDHRFGDDLQPGDGPEPPTESATVSTTSPGRLRTYPSRSTRARPPPSTGGDLTYTITVDNLGPNPAGDVVVALPVASGAAFVSATAGVGRCRIQTVRSSTTWAIWR